MTLGVHASERPGHRMRQDQALVLCACGVGVCYWTGLKPMLLQTFYLRDNHLYILLHFTDLAATETLRYCSFCLLPAPVFLKTKPNYG